MGIISNLYNVVRVYEVAVGNLGVAEGEAVYPLLYAVSLIFKKQSARQMLKTNKLPTTKLKL